MKIFFHVSMISLQYVLKDISYVLVFKEMLMPTTAVELVHHSWRYGIYQPPHSFNVQQMCSCNQHQWRTYTMLTLVPRFFKICDVLLTKVSKKKNILETFYV